MPVTTLPPLSLVPLETPAEPVVSDGSAPLSWPTPPYAACPRLAPWRGPEPCEIEGLNGKLMQALLCDFDPAQGLAQVQVPPSRTLLPLRLSQFRKLVLSRPLAPPAHGTGTALLGFHPSTEYRVTLADGPQLSGRTVGHVETEAGLYLFPPLDDSGTVTRLFCPRAAYQKVDFGKPLGEQLLADDTATPAQIRAALHEQQSLRGLRIGEVLLKNKVVSPEQMHAALQAQSRMPLVRVGEALMALGYINQTQLDEALAEQQQEKAVPLGELLVRRGVVQRHELRTALARKMGYPEVDVEAFPVEIAALKRVPIAVAKRLNVMPLQELPDRKSVV
jgi:hypothetical protein